MPLKTFIIYARNDKAHKDELLSHLKPLVAAKMLDLWHDGDMNPGEEWEIAIKKNLKASEIILILVSKHCLNSDFIQTEELEAALLKMKEGSAHIVPIIVSPCMWKLVPIFNNLQCLPEDAKPITTWQDKDEAWTDVAEGILKTVEHIHVEKAKVAAQKEAERLEKERLEKLRLEQKEKERLVKIAAEKRAEEQRLAKIAADKQAEIEKQERERLEKIAAEKAEKERLEKLAFEEKEKERSEKIAAEKAERERLEKMALEKQEKEHLAKIAAEKAEKERFKKLAAEKAEKAEKDRLQEKVEGKRFQESINTKPTIIEYLSFVTYNSLNRFLPYVYKYKNSKMRPKSIILTIILFIIVTTSLHVCYSIYTLPSLNIIKKHKSNLSTQIISSDRRTLGTFFSDENRIEIEFKDIPKYVINSLVVSQDPQFFNHSGVNFSCLYSVLTNETNAKGTISLQLVKNLYRKYNLTKFQECIAAIYLERLFTKEEIVTSFLNTVNFGGENYGIEITANQLFKKKTKDLTIQECVALISIIQDSKPSMKLLVEKNNFTIDLMVKNRIITKHVADSIKLIPLNISMNNDKENSLVTFKQCVWDFFEDWCSKNGYNPYTDGLKVFTTLDSRLQKYAEDAVIERVNSIQMELDKEIKGKEIWRKDNILNKMIEDTPRFKKAKLAGKSHIDIHREFQKNIKMTVFSLNNIGYVDTIMSPIDSLKYYYKYINAGCIAIEPNTGYVKAWVNWKSSKYFSNENSILSYHQAGSIFESFVYATAVDNGMLPCNTYPNEKICFTPSNSKMLCIDNNTSIKGNISVNQGFIMSVNRMTARMVKEFGPKIIANYMYQFGIKSKLSETIQTCFGEDSVNLLELVSSYNTFGNMGTHLEPTFIQRIEDRYGNIILEIIPNGNAAISEDKNYMMLNMLKDKYKFQDKDSSKYNNFKYEVAGQIGVTKNKSSMWFIGLTPSLSSGIWVGHSDYPFFNDNKRCQIPISIWKGFMKKQSSDNSLRTNRLKFNKPEDFNPKCSALK